MNKKGQSLALFLILIPVVVLILTFIFDKGLYVYYQNKYESISKTIIKEGFKDDELIKKLYLKNNYKVDNLKIERKSDKLYIINNEDVKTVFGSVLNIDKYKISINYIAFALNDDIIINDNKGDK